MEKMEEKIKFEVTQKFLEIIFTGLLELPSKYSLSVIQDLQRQVQGQLKEIKEDVSTDKENV
jgi:hypothetical protein